MSYTTVKLISEEHAITDIAELGNSWGAAAFVWSALSMKYLGSESGWIRNAKDVWVLWKDPRLSQAERIVLLSTFDNAIIEQERFSDAAKAFRAFSEEHAQASRVNHLPAIADLLEGEQHAKGAGMCFYQTSVSEDPWLGPWNEEKEVCEPFDWSAGKHFGVFASLALLPDGETSASNAPAQGVGIMANR